MIIKKYKNVLIILILLTLILSCTGCQDYMNERQVTCKVQDKWVKRSNGDDVYLVQCDDEVYKITDLTLYGKFNSTDIYARLKKNHKYKLTITGYRWRYWSEYPNINEYQEVK